MTAAKPKELSPAERLFVGEYLVDHNASAALMRCGWAPHVARKHAVHYLRKPHVRAAIELGIRRMEAHSVISATRILEELLCIAICNPHNVVNEDGTMKQLHELDEDTARAVAAVEVVTKPGRGDDPPTITHKLKFWDKGRAGETLLKSLGKLNDGVQVNTTVVSGGPVALEAARMLELENKLRETLGLEPVAAPTTAPVEEVSDAPDEEGEEAPIEAAAPFDLDDGLDDPAFL